MKEKIEEIKKRIKKSNFYKIFRFKSEIQYLNTKIDNLNNEKEELIDLVNDNKRTLKRFKNNDIKVSTYEAMIDQLDKELKKKLETVKKQGLKIRELNKTNEKLTTQNYELELECKKWRIQSEEYEAQIDDLKSDRYLVKKVKPGRKPNTQKTKISRPMKTNVVRFMRGEHE